jgi:hypothetical protein
VKTTAADGSRELIRSKPSSDACLFDWQQLHEETALDSPLA